jgi:hypothetical protein
MAMTLVSTVTIPSGGAMSLEWTNIPQTGKDLLVVYSLRLDASVTFVGVRMQLNGDTASNYSTRDLYGYDSIVGSGNFTSNYTSIGSSGGGTSITANTFNSGAAYIANYTSSSAKSISSDQALETNASTNYTTAIAAGSWSGTSAITSLKVFNNSYNYVQHSTASLYIIS